jgi:hypothetical protein
MQLQDAPPPPTLLLALPDGAAGVRDTLRLMSQLVKGGKKSPIIMAKARALTQGLPQKDKTGEIYNIWKFVKDGIRYVRDVRNVETVNTPEQTLRSEAGDCDDKALLTAALLESIGHPTAFWAIGPQPGKFTHVLTLTRMGPTGWLPLETTEPVDFGWRPKNVKASLVHYNK